MNKLEEKCLLTLGEFNEFSLDWHLANGVMELHQKNSFLNNWDIAKFEAQLKKATPILIAEGKRQMIEQIEKKFAVADIPQHEPYRGLVLISKKQMQALKKEVKDGTNKNTRPR